MKIVVLDAWYLTRGGLNFDALNALGEVTLFSETKPEERAARMAGAGAVLLNRTALGEEVLAACPQLRYIGITATGYNMVDVQAAKRRGIAVCNVPGYSTEAVAQHTFALLLEIARGTGALSGRVHRGEWRTPADAWVAEAPAFELNGKTLGVVGLGDIGREVARLGRAFGMRAIGCGRPGGPPPTPTKFGGIPRVELDTLLRESDVVSLHCPLSTETRGLMGEENIAKMKRGAVLLNTARGPILDEAALARALDEGRLYAAGLDVLSQEPPGPGNPLARHPRCVVTPHVAWSPLETRRRLIGESVENLASFLRGEARNRID